MEMCQLKMSGPTEATPHVMNRLPYLECAALATLFQDVLDTVSIIGYVIQHSEMEPVTLEYRSVEERVQLYMIQKRQKDIDTLTPKAVQKPYTKFQRDRAYIEEVFLRTKIELLEQRSFWTLLQVVKCHSIMKEDEYSLMEEVKQNRHTMLAIQRQLHNQKLQAEHNMQCVNEIIAKQSDKIEDILFENALRMRYIENWENARQEQNTMLCSGSEQAVSDTITKYQNEIEKEIRINIEIMNYVNEAKKDMEESMVYWVQKYDADSEQRQMEITIIKEKREQQQKDYEKLLETFEFRKVAIEEYLIHKAEKQKQEEYEEMLNEMAVRIQAWWRGVMVRKKLGPFRVKKKKGKDNAKDKQKGKDKGKKPKKGK